MLVLSVLATLSFLRLAAATLQDDPDSDEAILQELIAEDIADLQKPFHAPLPTVVPVGYPGSDLDTRESLNRTETAESAVWACDIRSWVRAPDMSPGATVPAEVRLAMNGTACGEVKSWSVGLALKERGAMKVKAPNATLPIEPVQNFTGMTMDSDSIYSNSMAYYPSSDYDQEYKAYLAALQDPALWVVQGQERVAFDARLDMPALEGQGDLDTVVPFFAHCPDTNLPPVLEARNSYWSDNVDGQFIGTEASFEYRVYLLLANGTTLEQPASKAGFIPAPVPAAADEADEEAASGTVQYEAALKGRRPSQKNDDWDPAPACEKTRFTFFNVSVRSGPYAVQGKNHTVSLTVTRSGNGTEFPRSLDLVVGLSNNKTWAFEYVDQETYINVTGDPSDSRRGGYISYPWGGSGSMGPRMLAAKTDIELYEERDVEENRRKDGGLSWRRGDVPRGAVRGILREDGEDRWVVEVELPISETAYPSFNRTFVSLQPTISISLTTDFACVNETKSKAEKSEAEDNWKEYSLPSRNDKDDDIYRYMDTQHRGSVPLDIISAPSNGEAQTYVKDYRDDTARAPVLSMTEDRIAEQDFPLLDQELRMEKVEEMKRHKYRYPHNGLLCQGSEHGAYGRGCWAKNRGGMGWHAAKMWQSKERAERH